MGLVYSAKAKIAKTKVAKAKTVRCFLANSTLIGLFATESANYQFVDSQITLALDDDTIAMFTMLT